jgi:ABC-type multidrug transport system ATPase subunit
LASEGNELEMWAAELDAAFARLKKKIASSTVPVGVSLLDDKLYDNLTVKENLNLLAGVSGATTAATGQLLEVFGLTEIGNRHFGTLDEALRQRAQLAASLVSDPELVIWEEPDLEDSEFIARLFDWLEENEIDVIFCALDPPEGAASRTIHIVGGR